MIGVAMSFLQVLDYKMTDDKLMEIVHVNLRHLEVTKAIAKIKQGM